jgi:hypothetical protein
LPAVNRLYDEMKGKGLEVALISFREPPGRVQRAARERRYTAPVLVDESGDLTGRVYGVWGPPTIYLVDRAGRLVGRATGPRDWSTPAARGVIQALLDAPTP